MELEPDFVLDASWFEKTFARFAAVSTKSVEELLKDQARLFVIDAIRVTPPFHQGVGQNATTAKKAGEKSISANLNRLFMGKDLVGSRRITHLFGRTDVPGLPYIVPAKERYPDVQGIYDEEKEKARLRAQRGMRFWQKQIPVSRVKARRIYRAEVKKVGWLAGGWNTAAMALGAGSKIPAFVRRHASAPGQVQIDFKPHRLRIVLVNQVKYADHVGGLQKRAGFALRKRADAMTLQIPRLIRAAERELRN
jgi:hypothetical protein